MTITDMISSVRWHHSFEVVPGHMTPGAYNPEALFNRLGLPLDLSGLRILDIGARDGFFSFKCEERGADVVAVDYIDSAGTGFSIASKLRQSKVCFIHENIYNLPQLGLGAFDIVLMLGVIYHLPDPCLSLEIVRSLCKPGATVYVESTCVDERAQLRDRTIDMENFQEIPVMVFVRRDHTTFWDLNSKCLWQLLDCAELRPADVQKWGYRMLIKASYVPEVVSTFNIDRSRSVASRG